jgi:hypothetical protein
MLNWSKSTSLEIKPAAMPLQCRQPSGSKIPMLAKINYRIHTDSIKQNLIPKALTKQQQSLTYASEADLLNVALFSQTAKEWRDNNSDKEENIRDYATLEHLLVLANMESLSAEYIKVGMIQSERLVNLNRIAIEQMKVLTESCAVNGLKKLGCGDDE